MTNSALFTICSAMRQRVWFWPSGRRERLAQTLRDVQLRGTKSSNHGNQRRQNSWFNFGRHNYDSAGNHLNRPRPDRSFAIQKVALLPEEFTDFLIVLNTAESKSPSVIGDRPSH